MKEYVKLISVGNATTRIVPISADLVRRVIPNANKETPLEGKWHYDESVNKLVLEVRLHQD